MRVLKKKNHPVQYIIFIVLMSIIKKCVIILFGLRRFSSRKTWSHVCAAFNTQNILDTHARVVPAEHRPEKPKKLLFYNVFYGAHCRWFFLLVHINTSQSNFRQIIYSYNTCAYSFYSLNCCTYTCVGALIKITIFFLSLFLFYLYDFNQQNTTKKKEISKKKKNKYKMWTTNSKDDTSILLERPIYYYYFRRTLDFKFKFSVYKTYFLIFNLLFLFVNIK